MTTRANAGATAAAAAVAAGDVVGNHLAGKRELVPDVSYLPKAASTRCASLTPAFCNCSRMIGPFAST